MRSDYTDTLVQRQICIVEAANLHLEIQDNSGAEEETCVFWDPNHYSNVYAVRLNQKYKWVILRPDSFKQWICGSLEKRLWLVLEMAVTNWDCVESTDWVGRRHLRNVCRMMRFEGVRSCKAELVARHPDLWAVRNGLNSLNAQEQINYPELVLKWG